MIVNGSSPISTVLFPPASVDGGNANESRLAFHMYATASSGTAIEGCSDHIELDTCSCPASGARR